MMKLGKGASATSLVNLFNFFMRTEIIAELASGHGGDLQLLKALVRAAAENGAQYAKVQDWRSANVPANDPDKKRYERYEFPDAWWPEFLKTCKENNIEPLTSCFNADRAKFLAAQGLTKIKLASISLTNTELLMAAGLYFDEVILSTAMHSQEEIEEAIDILQSNAHKFTLLHCVANYPLASKDAHLERINELKQMVEGIECASVGYSDHSLDLDVAKTAIGMGVKYVEKHFSLSRYLPQIPHQMYKDGPLVTTHQVSIEPRELKELAAWRDKVEAIKGKKEFVINSIEQKIKDRYKNRYGK